MATPAGHVYAVAQIKGGSGKSLMAMSLGVLLTELGRNAIWLDADPHNGQESVELMRKRRTFMAEHADLPGAAFGLKTLVLARSSETLIDRTLELTEQGKDVVIDLFPASNDMVLAAMVVADAILMPVRQGRVELQRFRKMEDLITRIQALRASDHFKKSKVYHLLTDYRATSAGKYLDEALSDIHWSSYLGIVPHSERIQNSQGDGLAAWEAYPKVGRATDLRALLLALPTQLR